MRNPFIRLLFIAFLVTFLMSDDFSPQHADADRISVPSLVIVRSWSWNTQEPWLQVLGGAGTRESPHLGPVSQEPQPRDSHTGRAVRFVNTLTFSFGLFPVEWF